MPIQMGGYSTEIICDMLSMEVTSVLLDRSWIYDVDAHNFGREITYIFMHNDKKIRLNPAKPSEFQPAKKDKSSFQPLVRKTITF